MKATTKAERRPILSIVIGTRNRPDGFRRLVESIERHTPMPWELIVSDASDTPIEEQEVATAETWPKIHVIPERPRLGMTRGYNRAFGMARGEWVIWLNDDCEVVEGWASSAIEFMKKHSEIGLGALYYAEPIDQTFKFNHGWDLPYANFGIIRRILGDELGWFDEEFEMYGNDNTLAFKVYLAGLGVAGIPDAHVLHHSVYDNERRTNEEKKGAASDLLRAKYWHLLPEMREVHERINRMVTA